MGSLPPGSYGEILPNSQLKGSAMPYVEVDGVRVHHVIHGPPGSDALTIVLVHGFTVDHRVLSGPLEPIFAGNPTWRRIYVDLPGHGLTEAPKVSSTDDVFAVLRGAVEALVPRRYAVVGQSYGGYLARGLVAAHRDRIDGMAIVVPVIMPRHEDRDLPPRQLLFRDPALTAQVGSEVLDADGLLVVQDENTWRAQERNVAPGLAVGDPAAIERISAAYDGTFPVDDEEFARPCLILAGRQDHVTGYRDAWTILEHYPRATFAVLDRAGHALDPEQPALLEALVGEWLGRVERTRSGLA